uniref:7TM_GPCR_Srx domain-containing protein n=1 Tax=Strongyloides venezuelensis TaxID=75913 RepID=A0A0K0FCI0_STRVS
MLPYNYIELPGRTGLKQYYHITFFEAKLIYIQSFNIYKLSFTCKWINIANNAIFGETSVISAILRTIYNIVILQRYRQVITKSLGNESSKPFLMFSNMALSTVCLVIFATEQLVRLYFLLDNKPDGFLFI